MSFASIAVRRARAAGAVIMLASWCAMPTEIAHAQAGDTTKARKGKSDAKAAGAKTPGAKTPGGNEKKKDAAADTMPRKPRKLPPLFESEAPLPVTLTANIRTLRRDKNPDAVWRPASVKYTDSAGKVVNVAVRARTRGIWRLKNCEFPPVRLKVADKDTKGTILHNLGEPKLVNYCRNSDLYDQYVLQELMLYRIYRVLTPVSHHVRLLKMTYADSASGKVEAMRWGFVIEDPTHVAERSNGTIVKQKGATAEDLDPAQSAIAFLFQYMIGNTDFSFAGLHNAELVRTSTGQILPIAYDFDFAGAIGANYAVPDPILRIRSVRERQFRGYCAFKADYISAAELFKAKKSAIYALYSDPVGQLLSPRIVKETLSYFDEFYRHLQTPKDMQRQVLDDCVGQN